MNKYLKIDERTVGIWATKKSSATEESVDEELQKRVQRAVKSIVVPADLKFKVLNFIKKQAQV